MSRGASKSAEEHRECLLKSKGDLYLNDRRTQIPADLSIGTFSR